MIILFMITTIVKLYFPFLLIFWFPNFGEINPSVVAAPHTPDNVATGRGCRTTSGGSGPWMPPERAASDLGGRECRETRQRLTRHRHRRQPRLHLPLWPAGRAHAYVSPLWSSYSVCGHISTASAGAVSGAPRDTLPLASSASSGDTLVARSTAASITLCSGLSTTGSG